MYETNKTSPETIFKDLENIYMDKLKLHGVEITSHVTWFSEKLTSSIDGLVIKNQDHLVTLMFFSNNWWFISGTLQHISFFYKTMLLLMEEIIFLKKKTSLW